MRRFAGLTLSFVLAVLAVAVLTGRVDAQPKVTITGLVDNVTSWNNNLSMTDFNLSRKDSEWYARTRARPDITAEVGTTKFVLGIEIDYVWGQTAGQDTNVCLSAACPNSPQRFGASGGADLNTDVQGILEVKWAYTEFDVPLMPVPTRLRVGAQPFQIMYKAGAFGTGDFAGAHLSTNWSSMLRSHFTYIQIDEASTGPKDGFIRGDDVALVASVEITPFKGLDIRPIFSYVSLVGVTSSASVRQARGGLGTGAAVYPTCPGTAGPGTGGCLGVTSSAEENRYTVGVDARWKLGAFYVDPTLFYQFGTRDQVSPVISATSGPRVLSELKRDAWYFDVRSGWQAGPLLVEGAFVYTSGNDANDRIDLNRSRLKYFEPISTDRGFYSGWCEILCSGIDYSNRFRASTSNLDLGHSIGYDKYGLILVGARASYALTPAFTLRAAANARWTAHEVDTASRVSEAAGLTPRCTGIAVDAGTCADRGTASYFGTEMNLGFQWRLAPNVAFDMVGSYFFAGSALSSPLITPDSGAVAQAQSGRDPRDIQTVSARVRYTF
jgi:hypothetical protein